MTNAKQEFKDKLGGCICKSEAEVRFRVRNQNDKFLRDGASVCPVHEPMWLHKAYREYEPTPGTWHIKGKNYGER